MMSKRQYEILQSKGRNNVHDAEIVGGASIESYENLGDIKENLNFFQQEGNENRNNFNMPAY